MPEIDDALAKFSEIGITAISEFDDRYPQRWIQVLGQKRPPLLFAAGHLELLSANSFGIVGSRDVDEAGAEFAATASRIMSEEGYVIVSGGAKGVDKIAMQSAFESGGDSIGFLSDSLTKVVKTSHSELESGRICLATSYSPDAGFSVGNAMGRNKLIYGHSVATLVVSSALETGGTWAGADEALKNKYSQILVRDGDDVPDGNRALIRMGAIPVRDPREIVAAIAAPAPGTLF
jgi:predicted Rossmann fold nucleotide-binding protein DprA/Smf involved in DNA uptake